MTKYEQKCVNLNIDGAYEKFKIALCSHDTTLTNSKQLRSCSATVFDIADNATGEILYHGLRSYNTIVAFIDVQTDTLYDVLRLVYGYTSTSAQHISKFAQDFGRSKWGCANVLRYYPV